MAAGHYPLTAPLVRPLTNSFCSEKKRMAGGMMARSVPARKMPYWLTYSETKKFKTTGRVSLACVWRKTFGAMKLFHDPRNATRQKAALMGRTSGMIRCK